MTALAWTRPIALGVLFGCAVVLLLRRDGFRVLLGFYLLSSAVNLLILWSEAWPSAAPPILGEPGGTPADPLAQSFVLTAIVITLGTTALFAGTLLWNGRIRRTLRLDRLTRLRG